MSNYYIMSQQTPEGQPQKYFVNTYPTAPPVIVEQNNIQSTVNQNYPAYNPNTYKQVITYADYEKQPRRIRHPYQLDRFQR